MIGELTGDAKAAGYGELLPIGMLQMGSTARLGSKDCFIDIGSGTGKVALQAATDYNVASSVGIEISPTRHAIAQTALQQLLQTKPDAASRVRLMLGDAMADPEAKSALRKATVVYSNNLLFGNELNARLAALVHESAARVVIVSKPFDGGIVGFTSDYSPIPCPMSWQVPIRAGEPMPPGHPCTVYRRSSVERAIAEPLARVKFSIDGSEGGEGSDGSDGSNGSSDGSPFESPATRINLIYDSKCGVCQWEVENLRSLGSGDKILFTDCEDLGYDPQLPRNGGVSYESAMARIHAVTSRGEVLDGMQVFAACYEQVGWGAFFAFTRLPVIGPLVELGYSIFAKVRTQVTRGASLEELVVRRGEECAACEKR